MIGFWQIVDKLALSFILSSGSLISKTKHAEDKFPAYSITFSYIFES